MDDDVNEAITKLIVNVANINWDHGDRVIMDQCTKSQWVISSTVTQMREYTEEFGWKSIYMHV